jgi:hypothetical protein
MSDKVLSWLWLPAHTGVEVGQTLTTEGPLKYASPRALDALRHASGPVICRISSSGKVLAMADATTVLHEFGCWYAELALLQAGHEPDPRSWNAIKVKRKWIKGKATDEELDAARDAAWDAEWEACYVTSDVALAAASAAARDAAWTVASAAARDAAWTVARVAASDTAWTVARVAASDAARVITTAAARAAVSVTASDAVWGAAWAAGWDAVRTAQNAKLEEMLNDLLKEGEGK